MSTEGSRSQSPPYMMRSPLVSVEVEECLSDHDPVKDNIEDYANEDRAISVLELSH